MRNIFREGQETLITMTRLERKKGKFLVIGIELVLLVLVIIPILTFSLPAPWYWNLVIIIGAPLVVTLSWRWFGRIDPNEVTDNPLSVIDDALNKPQQETLPLEIEEDLPPTQKVIRIRRRKVTSMDDGARNLRRIPKEFRKDLAPDEKVTEVFLLHYLKVLPVGIVTLLSFVSIWYVRTQPKSDWWWMVILIVAFAVIVGMPIYRQVRRLIQITKWRHVIGAGALLLLVIVFVRDEALSVLSWIAESTWKLLKFLGLDSLSLENFMSLIAWIALVQFVLRLLDWQNNPVIVTSERVFFTYGIFVQRSIAANLNTITEKTVRHWTIIPRFSLFRFTIFRGLYCPFVSLLVETTGGDPTKGVQDVHWMPSSKLGKINAVAQHSK